MRRNVEKGNTYSFDVTPAMFDAIELCFSNALRRGRSAIHG